ncbi:hypothetical protein HETIRDRAFT_108840 [Heterobasidion irregulare TC 32-1]|uniref:Transmembrane protein n=1 Tax=Heterobasidion irregulare (strain TC 32-1) TaxID=747525 RepID=W4KA07_HETIT|nr:uncharacterized protein HETIRDRAFT_108840 [Heterobasidion irregulare TC 32-1]ETW82584.1 hypothetical protein HETIRDRAFT_108840 [Heterobasidion irregulare TC 32-1]
MRKQLNGSSWAKQPAHARLLVLALRLFKLVFGFAFILVAFATLSVRGAYSPARRATVCNGHAELCGRSYGNLTFVGAHDSLAFSNDSLALARDQKLDIPTQLSLGIRLLQAQAHENLSVLTASSIFVIRSLSTVWEPAFNASGVADLAYVPLHVPLTQNEWPTLGQTVDSGKRVVVFMDFGAESDEVDFILPEFEMVWETPFSVTDASFPCSVNRIKGPLSTEEHMYMINYSLNIDIFVAFLSDPAQASKTNGVTFILAHASGHFKPPTL